MPEISRFYGISIYMYKVDHPPPHIHGRYAGKNFVVRISDGAQTEGQAPVSVLRRVRQWVNLHRDELLANWELLQRMELPKSVDPLD